MLEQSILTTICDTRDADSGIHMGQRYVYEGRIERKAA